MKLFYFLLISSTLLFSKTYQAKLEPFETYTILSEVNAKVLFVNEEAEYKTSKKKIIRLDDNLEKSKAENLKKKIVYFKDIIKIKTSNLNKLLKISGKSKIAKDNSKIDLLNSKVNLLDLEDALNTLNETIAKKNILSKGLYISEIFVKKYEFVTVGRKLLSLEDRSKSKLVIYVDAKDLDGIEDKTILVNGEAGKFKLLKYSTSNDSKFSSSYKVELFSSSSVKRFGEILSIEIK